MPYSPLIKDPAVQQKTATTTPAQPQQASAQLDRRASALRATQLRAMMDASPIHEPSRSLQQLAAARTAAPAAGNGLPAQLKAGIESLSGIALDHVNVHYNSPQPAQLHAHAYAQGSDIHVAPGQERHLPHEAWHVVQQTQGRVRPTLQLKEAMPLNDDASLEREADVMGARAMQEVHPAAGHLAPAGSAGPVLQRFIDDHGLENGEQPIGVRGRYVQRGQAIYLQSEIGTFYLQPANAVHQQPAPPHLNADAQMGPVAASSGSDAALLPDSADDAVLHLPQADGGDQDLEEEDADPLLDEVDIEEDDEAEISPEASKNHHLGILESRLNKAQQYFEEDSSDSEIDEEDADIKAGKYKKPELEAARRLRKRGEIESIIKTSFPVDDNEMQGIQELEAGREADFKARAGKRGRYSRGTIEKYRRRGLEMKKTNLYHNTYLRRAARKATSKSERASTDSKGYEGRQGKIREKLREVLVDDSKKMAWKEEDFSSAEMWNLFQWMLKNTWSNAASGDRLHEHRDAKPEDKKNPRAAFHHIYWKESYGARSSKYALTPANLTLRQDDREMDEKKKTARAKAGKPAPKPGNHEYDHRTTGYQKDDAKRFPGHWIKGGHFVAMDPEAVVHTMEPMLAKRESKLAAAKQIVEKSQKRKREPEAAQSAVKSSKLVENTHPLTSPDDVSSDDDFFTLLLLSDEDIAFLQQFLQEERLREMQSRDRGFTVNGSDLDQNIVGIGSMGQFQHECGQLGAFNAALMENFSGVSMEDIIGDQANLAGFMGLANDQARLNLAGNFENDMDEAQVMHMLYQLGAANVTVVNNFAQMQGILHGARRIDQRPLFAQLGANLYFQYAPGVNAMLAFIRGDSNRLNLVLNTASDGAGLEEGGDAVLHWIAVRLERAPDGTVQTYFMDSLNGAESYSELMAGLKNLLH